MVTRIEDSNLAHIGSEEDAAARKAAAETEVNWDTAGKTEGIQIWRVENGRDEKGNPKFGINAWPKECYGEFYSGDSYIVLLTKKDGDNDGGGGASSSFKYDIFFWIGSSSSQDEYGVAAYKANELDDLLDDAPVQHREVQHYESELFLDCFNGDIKYLDGGIDSGFRDVDEHSSGIKLPKRMYRMRKTKRATTQCIQVAPTCDSLNNGDAFVLQTDIVLYCWFGEHSSPFEKAKARQVAHNMASASNGKLEVKIVDNNNDDEDFWIEIGGKGHIKDENEDEPIEAKQFSQSKMYVLSEVDSVLKVEEREANSASLVSNDVCLIDVGKTVFVWIGNGSTKREQSQAMILVHRHLLSLGRAENTGVVRVKEGQESRVTNFESSLQ